MPTEENLFQADLLLQQTASNLLSNFPHFSDLMYFKTSAKNIQAVGTHITY